MLLFLLLVVSVGVTVFVYGASNEVSRAIQSDQLTKSALEQARDALIARAVGDSNRPGSLPCPDTDDDGRAELLVGTECPSYIGRLPWRTLGTGDLRDEGGERLWYVLSPNFRDATNVTINSNTIGNRPVYNGVACGSVNTNACTPTNREFPQPGGIATQTAAALVLAPGIALPGQVRNPGSAAACAPTGTMLPQTLCAANYLESDPDATHPGGVVPWNNAVAAGPFMNASARGRFNDKVAVIANADFMHLVERRVAADLLDALRDYRAQSKVVVGGCDCLPWPDRTGDGSSDADNNRGRLQVGAARTISGITRANPGVVTTSAAHGFVSGQSVYLTDIAGMTQLNGAAVTVTVLNATQFSIGVNTNAYTAYVSGGRAFPNARPHSWYRSISAITRANPGVITTTSAHGFSAGQRVYLSGIAGMPQLNGQTVTVTPLTLTTFSIGIDTSQATYGTYTSGGTTSPSGFAYIEANNWANVLYYTVGKSSLELSGGACTFQCTASTTLSINGTAGQGVVLITPGPIAPGQVRTAWAHYIDDAENRDANPQPADPGTGAVADPAFNDAYRTPPQACPTGECPANINGVRRCVASAATCPVNVTSTFRDRLYSIPSPNPPIQCGAHARSLVRNAPCHTTGTNVKPPCQNAYDNLTNRVNSCPVSCGSAANTMITPPCRNTLNPPECQTAVTTLNTC